MDVEGIKIVHALPGRIRLKVAQVRDNPTFASQLRERLSVAQGIQKVEVNPLTGSVLVLYDAKAAASPEAFRTLAEPLLALFPGLTLQDFESLHSLSANGSQIAPPLSGGIRTLFGTLNAGVHAATGGNVDLKLLLPLALLVLGIRGLLVSEKTVFPAWYDYLWFALGTYFMLNPKPEEGQQ
jgi:hypothetical protein